MPRLRAPELRAPKSSKSGTLELSFVKSEAGQNLPVDFSVKFNSLTEHAIVAGGQHELRTEICKQLLAQVAVTEIPFLVVSSSRSYRSLLQIEQPRQAIAFYTAGEQTLPFGINVFELVPGVSVASHIARVAAIFKNVFDLSIPAASAFEKAIEAMYVRRGWNLLDNANRRLTPDQDEKYQGDIYPVLSETLELLDEGIEACNFEAQLQSDVKSLLQSVLTPLVTGINKSIFNIRSASSAVDLFTRSLVIETSALRSPQDRAFYTAIILNFCEECIGASSDELRHLTVIDDCGQLPQLFGSISSARGDKVTTPIPVNLEVLSRSGYGVVFSGLRGSQLESTRLTQPGLSILFRERNTFALSNIGAFLKLHLSAMNTVKGLLAYELAILYPERSNDLEVFTMNATSKENITPDGGTLLDDQIVAESLALSQEFIPFPSAGREYFPEAFDPESVAVAEKLIQNKFFYRVFVRYIASFTNDLTQLVHFRAQVIHEIQRIIGRRTPDALRRTSWCAISLASDRYFGDKALVSHWTLDEERSMLHRWYGLLAPAFVPEAVNNSLNRKLNIVLVRGWRDDFLASQAVDQGPLPACGACTAKCLYGYDVTQFLADPGLFFDFNSTISRRDTPASESCAWFVRLLCERLIESFNLDLAYCLAVHLIKAQQLSTDAQLVLLRKVHQHLLLVNSEGDALDPAAKTDEVRILQFPKIIKDR